ncbi:hypothetical protein QM284_22170, partial [Stutzerimonas stutzeri]|nr:hypothetical protein [Stutzerimonas stutzeri]
MAFFLFDSFYTWPKHAALDSVAELAETSVLSISGVSNGSLYDPAQLRAGGRLRQLRRRPITTGVTFSLCAAAAKLP